MRFCNHKIEICDECETIEITHPINMDWVKFFKLQEENAHLRSALEKVELRISTLEQENEALLREVARRS